MENKIIVNEGLKREFNIVVSKEEVSELITLKAEKLSKETKIQGFRPGKIPIKLIMQKYKTNILQEALEELLKDTSEKIIEEQDFKIALQPSFKIIKFSEDSELEYNLSLELLPEISIPDFTKITLERLVCDVSNKDIDDYISKIAISYKNFVEMVDKKAELGDAVLINCCGKLNGLAFDGGTIENHQLELGSKSFIDGFEDQLIGSKAGEHRLLKLQFPQQYHVEKLAGKNVEFEVEIKSVLTLKPVEINDELAKKFGSEDLTSFAVKVKEEIVKKSSLAAREKIKKQLLDELEKLCDYEVPQGMVDLDFNDLWSKFLDSSKKDPEFSAEKTEEEFKVIYQKIAKRRVMLGLLFVKISSDENILADQESIKAAIYKQASNFVGQENLVVEYYRKNTAEIDRLKGPIIEEKVIDFILEKIQYIDKILPLDQFNEEVKLKLDDF